MIVILLLISTILQVKSDNFPSLISANATLAIVIDKEYLADDYEDIKNMIDEYVIYAKREILKHGGVNLQYFSWTSINIKRDFTAVLSVASCVDTWKLFKLAQEETIFHMAITESDCPRLPLTEAITIPMISNGGELPQLILDSRTMQAYKWQAVNLIYDYTLERDVVQRMAVSITKISDMIPTNAAALTLINVETDNTSSINREIVKDMLQKIPNDDDGLNFMAVVSNENMEMIMEFAKLFGLANTKNQWLYVVSDTNSSYNDISGVKRLLREGDNVSFLYNTTSGQNCKAGVKCHLEEMLLAFTTSLDMAIINEIETSSTVSDEEWEEIRPTKQERKDGLLHDVRAHLLQNGICGNCTTWKFEAGETWGKEYQVYASNVVELIDVGYWRPIDGTSLKDELFPHISHGFRGRMLPIVTMHNPPWQILKINQTGQVIGHKGLIFDVIKELAKHLNFTYIIKVVTTKSHKIDTNLTDYNTDMLDTTTNIIPEQIIKLVQSKAVAIAACGFTITEREKTFINFTSPINTLTYSFMVARPKELSRALLFMSPFSANAWLCIASTLILMGPILYIVHVLSPVYGYKGIDIKGGLSSIENCIWYMYGALLQQGGMHLPYADSARLVVGTWWLVVLVISTTYSGNLVAFLTFPKIDIPITRVDDMLEHREMITWSISKGSFLEEQLKITNEPKYRELYKGMITKPLSKSEMLMQIVNGKHVYIDWKIKLQYMMSKQYIHTDRCDLALGKEEFCDEQIAMIVAQDTPYLGTINKEIKRLHQVGLINKWLQDYMPKKDRCSKIKYSEVNNHTVNMDDMQGSFFVLFLGFLIGIIIITIEKLWKIFQTRSNPVVTTYVK